MRFHVKARTTLSVALIFTALVFPRVSLASGSSGAGVDEPSTVQHVFGVQPFDGTTMDSTLVMSNGRLYGTTVDGGPSGLGSIYQISPLGEYQSVYSFGVLPSGPSSLIVAVHQPNDPTGPLAAVGSVIYGTTKLGGFYNGGTLYSYDTLSGRFTILHNFGGYGSASPTGVSTDGMVVIGSLTTAGAPANTGGLFTYNISTGKYALYPFNVTNMKNSKPSGPPVLLDGTTWAGVTTAGGTQNAGTIYTFSLPTGTFAYDHNFSGVGADAAPVGVTAVAGGLYGVTGTSTQPGELFSLSFSTSNPVSFSVLHPFGLGGGTDPSQPSAAPTLVATPFGQMLVGLLKAGGNGYGAVYTVGLDGSNYSIIHTFAGTDSGIPDGGLVTGPDGNLWGTGNPIAFNSSVFRLGPQINNGVPIATDVNNGGNGDLLETLNGTGFATNVTAMFDHTPVAIPPGGSASKVSLQIPASLLTAGSHVITLGDPNIGNVSNTLVIIVGGVHFHVSFGTPSNANSFQEAVTIANTGYSSATDVRIVSAQLVYPNGNTVPLTVTGNGVSIPLGQSSEFSLSDSMVVASGSPVLILHWAYSGGMGGAAVRLQL